MQQGCIYQLKFPNDKLYVGQTRRFRQRMLEHRRCDGRTDGHLVKRAINKHGWDNVQVSVLAEVQCAELNAAEKEWIARLGTLKPHGYNTTPGGDAQPMDDPEVRARQRRNVQVSMRSTEVREKKRLLWKTQEYTAMQRRARTTESALSKRAETFRAKREERVLAMDTEEGMKPMQYTKAHGVKRAKECSRGTSGFWYGLRSEAKVKEDFDNEIAYYEREIWGQRTLASSRLPSNDGASTSSQYSASGASSSASTLRKVQRMAAHSRPSANEERERVRMWTEAWSVLDSDED
jgi:group I intron endonuclease